MTSKLQIRLGDLTLDVEGDPELVREVYRDLREQIGGRLSTSHVQPPLKPTTPRQQERPDPSEESRDADESGVRRKPAKRKRAAPASNGEGRVDPYTPAMVKDLDLKGLSEFYGQYKPKNHPEKVLIFVQFLKNKGHDPCTANQIFSCYAFARVERPKAFKQAIIDAHSNKHSFIDYKSVNDISLTHLGEDHLHFHMKKADV